MSRGAGCARPTDNGVKPTRRSVPTSETKIIGPLAGLNGRVAEIVTVWIILAVDAVPRFVTAYPKD